MSSPHRLGIIGSSGGSALAAAAECLAMIGRGQSWCVLTDRECGISTWAKTHAVATIQIEYGNSRVFSEKALSFFNQERVRGVLLFYTRRVDSPLIGRIETYNIHPSLLPAFPGLGAVRKALHAGIDNIGATLHRVDYGLDTGPIVLQTTTAIAASCTLERAERISFLQKTWLTLRWCEMMATGTSPSVAPPLSRELCEAFLRFQKKLGCMAIPNPEA
jgi:phosphoribosylglycinamide formyltransferase-1